MVFVFLLIYFTQYENLYLYPCCYYGIILFFFMAKLYSIVYMYHIFSKILLLQLIYNILSIFAVQQSDPVTHIHTFFFSNYPPSQVTRYSSLCYIAGSHCLSTPNASTNSQLPVYPTSSPLSLGNNKSVLHVHEFVSFLQVGSFVPYARFQI